MIGPVCEMNIKKASKGETWNDSPTGHNRSRNSYSNKPQKANTGNNFIKHNEIN